MRATTKRHIAIGYQYDTLFPKPIGQDTVVVGQGKARLKDTLNLIKEMILQTTADTAVLAPRLKGNGVMDTCRNIWNFVYGHIQYTMDKTGIEQVRRPSRTWADRISGVDCDCYTVFIGSILANLSIPFMIRITKYGGKAHFQHVYPVVFTNGKQITIDCVTDQFNKEVTYSEKKDISITDPVITEDISGLSGVDTAAIALDALEQSPIPLREIIQKKDVTHSCPVHFKTKRPPKAVATHRKQGKTVSPFRFDDQQRNRNMEAKEDFNLLNFLIIASISVAAGIGVLQLLSKTKQTKTPKKKTTVPKP
ncbi:hypothetical protein [Aquimarina sediminis]|uniref:hypothetical protein n=1 Tax=Aquimarina sediminis TaxID=2070536 RepID=UPI000CA05BFC|nr:hypothetical protein [Aquimarina sediminis]